MGIPLVYSTDTQSAVSLDRYRARLARLVGHFQVYTAVAASAALEPTRTMLCTELRSDAAPTTLLDGMYCYITDGTDIRAQRMVINGSYVPYDGSFLVDREFSATIGSGVTFELSTLPAATYLGVTGMNQLVDDALETLPVLDFFQLTAVDQQLEYSLAEYPWPIKGVRDVIYPRTSTTTERRRTMDRGRWSFTQDANIPKLEFYSQQFNAGDVFEVAVIRPANTWVKSGGVWGDSLTGLSLDADEALYDVLTVAKAAEPLAMLELAKRYPQGSKEQAEIKQEASEKAVTAAVARFYGRFKGSGRQSIGGMGAR